MRVETVEKTLDETRLVVMHDVHVEVCEVALAVSRGEQFLPTRSLLSTTATLIDGGSWLAKNNPLAPPPITITSNFCVFIPLF